MINNIDEPAAVVESMLNTMKPGGGANYLRFSLTGPPMNREGIGTKVFVRHGGSAQYQYFSPVRGYLSSVEPLLHFGLGTVGTVDSVEVVWPDGKYQLLQHVKTNQVLDLDYALASAQSPRKNEVTKPQLFEEATAASGIDYKHQENAFVDFKVQPTLPHMHSRNGPGIAVGDVNGDGLEDFYVGGAKGFAGALFVQQAGGEFQRMSTAGMDSVSEEMGVLLFDADNDNDLDLYSVSGGSEEKAGSVAYRDHLYLNDGAGNFTLASGALPDLFQSGSCVVAADYDRDGDLDLFVGSRLMPGAYPMPAESYLLRNDSKGGVVRFTVVTDDAAKVLHEAGMICAALWSDYDNDGWPDLIIAGEFTPVRFLHNVKGRLVDETDETGMENTSGWWNSIAGGDFDGDGDTDYVVGNLGTNTHFHATDKEPLCIYAKDYNNDGRVDPVMSYYMQGKKYVGHSRDNLIDQINAMRSRFRTYTDYANATFEESFLPEELEGAYVVCSERFESSYVENLGNGKFKMKALPLAAQFSPVYGMVVDDYDNDGNLDVVMVGNSYSPEVSSGRDDASVGLYLRGDGKGNLEPVRVAKSGFMADKDGKGLAELSLQDGRELVIIGNNSGAMRAYATRDSTNFYRPGKDDAYAMITLQNGKVYKHEFYFGSTYLSQSSRNLKITPTVTAVSIFDRDGKKTTLSLDHINH